MRLNIHTQTMNFAELFTPIYLILFYLVLKELCRVIDAFIFKK